MTEERLRQISMEVREDHNQHDKNESGIAFAPSVAG
jgi:hypothetical protein